jgi:ribosomal protein S18 acetylase RimI-like enzyme
VKRRAFAGESDLYELQAFTARAIREHGRVGMLHPGDIAHHVYNGLRRENPHELVHLWEDDHGVIQAWTLLDPRRADCDPQMNPGARSSAPGLEEEIYSWSEQTLLKMMADDGLDATFIETDAYESDVVRIGLLESRGWVAQDVEILMLTRRSLDELEQPALPDGYRIRTARGPEEAGAISELHAAGFGSSWTPELYERVMTSPGYSADREFLVEAPNGQLAAFCVTWLDELNRTGYFEPVAVHPDYRRLGLARAVMRAAMIQMKQWGMEHAEVMYETGNPGSGGLYRGEGFVPIHKIILFRKPISKTEP